MPQSKYNPRTDFIPVEAISDYDSADEVMRKAGLIARSDAAQFGFLPEETRSSVLQKYSVQQGLNAAILARGNAELTTLLCYHILRRQDRLYRLILIIAIASGASAICRWLL